MAKCCRMNPAEFRQRAIVQRNSGTGTYDSLGQETHSWVDDITIGVKIEPLNGQEIELVRQLYAQATYRVYTPYRKGLTTRKRLKIGTRTLNIGYVDDINPHQDIRMFCSEDSPST